MSLFHTHKWQVVSTDYTPGMRFTNVERAYAEELANLAAGTTHIYLKCTECGDIQQKDVVGKYHD